VNIHHHQCPICGAEDIRFSLRTTDFTVSGTSFEIWECGKCTLRFTQDAPDAATIGQYYDSEGYISHSDTSKGLINSIYHAVRHLTMAGKRRLILSLHASKIGSLLDIGAGTGSFVRYMSETGWEVTGVEPDEQARAQAQKVNHVRLSDSAELLHFPAESFDMITMWHVLEHVHDLHAYVERLKWLVKPKGKILIAVPNYTSYDASVYRNYWAAYDVPRHLYHFSPRALKTLLDGHGMELRATRAMWYDSFYISMMSERNRKEFLGFFRGLWIGSISDLHALINRETCSSLIYIVNR